MAAFAANDSPRFLGDPTPKPLPGDRVRRKLLDIGEKKAEAYGSRDPRMGFQPGRKPREIDGEPQENRS